MKLTIYFEDAFWYGLVEYTDSHEHYRVIKYTFGSEPKDFEVLKFIHQRLPALISKNDRVAVDRLQEETPPSDRKMNPKRMQRAINKQKKKPAVSTKAQMELTKVHELMKKEKKRSRREKKQEQKDIQYQLRRKKRFYV
ncbi:YjdF family protein [Streptococcus oricebi]|uniref:DUF2992 domain-containing protein n=1 Tax=Streptococcus oricebi TaxID=1547447 RepID=A0ABS5B188_9STRE|nr:YjdF family protein [Streptococcus oricebi]MBP2622592.1 DUF2992 domain-containing protein [Streptococcus oricebi]